MPAANASLSRLSHSSQLAPLLDSHSPADRLLWVDIKELRDVMPCSQREAGLLQILPNHRHCIAVTHTGTRHFRILILSSN